MRPNRRISPAARALALHRPPPLTIEREWITAFIAVAILAAGLLGL
ncbi:MAG TPA: hypothetical protein VFP50_15795 [Anaeromyxobacteraceae bacterium]|nr:hypothetical protein [Anaeromyxobacteraceae bacterium]